MAVEISQRQVNIRLDPTLYRALESVARQERRSIGQAARLLLEDGLRRRHGQYELVVAPTSEELATLVITGGAFDWLANEPDIYDETSGEPIE